MDIKEIRNKELELLQHLDNFCKQNGIQYYLSNGTLLGAVKYRGFIPWDDDIDVVLLREDYDRLISIYSDGEYILYEPQRHKDYRYPFAKLSDTSTYLCENGIRNGVELGINIDIFPLDYVGSNYEKSIKLARKLHRVSMLLLFSKKEIRYQKKQGLISNIQNFMFGIAAKCFRPKTYIRYIQKKAATYAQNKESKYVASLCWPVYKEKEVIPKDFFSQSVTVIFENDSYPAPTGYDQYLRSLYGNYEQDPPLEKQVSHHDFKVYKKV